MSTIALPADIAAAIDRYRDASRLYFHRMSEDNAVRMCDARAALDAAILRHLSVALARADHAEARYEDLRNGPNG